MSSHYQSITMLSEMRDVLNDGFIFYQQGITRTSYNRVRAMCTRMVEEKRQAMVEITAFIAPENTQIDTRLPWGEKIKTDYQALQHALTQEKEAVLSSRLNDIENQVLQRFDEMLETKISNECAQVLRKIRTRMLQCHDELTLLIQQLSA